MNDAKSVPFAHMRTVENPCTPPSNQKAHHSRKLCKIRKPFSDLHHGKWNSQNLQRIVQNPPNPPPLVHNFTKFAQSVLISQGSLYPLVKLSKFAPSV